MKPRLLDLFCGAGGATKGYQRAGFYVVGVDIEPQLNFCGDEFIQADAMQVLRSWEVGGTFDAIHASPPCQHYANVTRWRGRSEDHPDLIPAVRAHLTRWALPWVIENVRTKALRDPVMLCGTQFGLTVRRHRYFESNWPLFELLAPCQHRSTDHAFDHGVKHTESEYRAALGCDWMTVRESREAIPPVFTEHIGRKLLAHLEAKAA